MEMLCELKAIPLSCEGNITLSTGQNSIQWIVNFVPRAFFPVPHPHVRENDLGTRLVDSNVHFVGLRFIHQIVLSGL